MSEAPDSATPKHLAIRSAPAPVRRVSKTAIVTLLGCCAAIILGSLAFAMSSKQTDMVSPANELYSTTNKPRAEGLVGLPVSYADMPEKVEILGPPLPGDLGAPILQARRERAHLQAPIILPNAPPSDAELEALDRKREQVETARKSGLFFSNAANTNIATEQTSSCAGALSPPQQVQAAFNGLKLGTVPGFSAPDPGFQMRKEEFVSETSNQSIYNSHRLETPRSPWQIMAGTIIPATLITAINSDLPGQVVGQVTEPVYDTVTGQTVLIPQGSRLIGRYDSVIAYGQSRALVVWNRIIMPDGTSIQIDNLNGVDGRGNAGLKDRVDNHSLRIFSAAALSSLISVGAELSDDNDDQIARALRDASQNGASRVGEEIVRRGLSIQPTLTIRPGWRFRVLVHQDIILQPYGDL